MSRPRVTITLGRNGQVIREAGVSDENYPGHQSFSGTKRPIQERLGRNIGSPLIYGDESTSKRRRFDDHSWNSAAHSGKEDLRLKLIRKHCFQREGADDWSDRNNADLREKLSRVGRSSAKMAVKSHMPDPRKPWFAGRLPPTRSADDLLQIDSLRRSYSSWNINELRHKSPERIVTSRAISPPAKMDQLWRLRSTQGDRTRQLPLANKAPISAEPAKPVVRLAPPPVVNGLKQSCPAAEHPVSSFLHSLGLSKYAILFQAEEVDMTALRQMGDSDLKELGIPMGPRKKILLALLPRTRPRQG